MKTRAEYPMPGQMSPDGKYFTHLDGTVHEHVGPDGVDFHTVVCQKCSLNGKQCRVVNTCGWKEIKKFGKVRKLCKEQAFLVMAYTGCNTMNVDEFKKEVENRFGKSYMTADSLRDKVCDDFVAICFN